MYSYTNNKGVTRQVELSHVGQTEEYVPTGGGVQCVVVKSLEKGPGRLAVGIVGSFERASPAVMCGLLIGVVHATVVNRPGAPRHPGRHPCMRTEGEMVMGSWV